MAHVTSTANRRAAPGEDTHGTRPGWRALGTAAGLVAGWAGLSAVLRWALRDALTALGGVPEGLVPPPDVLLALLAGGAAWLVTTVLAGLGLLGLVAAAPGLARHAVGAAAARCTPGFVRRAVTALLGLSVGLPVAGSTAAGAATSITPPTPWAPVATGSPAGFVADRPAGDPLSGATPPVREVREVVVRPGDTLWGLVAAHLGPTATERGIAAEWPRWHAANRSVIGADPGRLYPGQRLVVPPPIPRGPQAPAASPQA
jgi:hypothetical protein